MRYVKIIVIVLFIAAFMIFVFAEIDEFTHKDINKPVIESSVDVVEISVNYTDEDLLKGIHASDKEDGDLTSEVMIGEFSRFIEEGVSSVTYVVFDSANQMDSLTRKVRFIDYESPKFTLIKPLVWKEGQGNNTKLQQQVGAQDVLEGNLDKWVVLKESNVNYAKAGSYITTFEVINRYGDSETVVLPVHIVDKNDIDIQLKENIVYLKVGASFNPKDWIKSAHGSAGENIQIETISVESNIGKNAGVYEVHYYVDAYGKRGDSWLTVIVR